MFGSCPNEEKAIISYCLLNRIPYKVCQKQTDVPDGFIPVGNVDFCESFIQKDKTLPNYFPHFVKDYLFRDIWTSDKWVLKKNVFVKPADKHKRFNGFITIGGYRKKKKGPLICSSVVKFINEWRYYISNGKVLTGEWYSGDEENTPDAPLLDIEIPENFCGTIDMGMLDTGKFAVVECHPPYSCGWYGKDDKLFVKWIIDGWVYLQ